MDDQELESTGEDQVALPGSREQAERRGRGPGRPFLKGQSGNPAGRPRWRGGAGTKGDRLVGSDEPTRAMMLDEAYRLLPPEDEDTLVGIPAHRAVFRALMRTALGGNQIAQRQFTMMVNSAEQAQKRDQLALYNLREEEEVPKRYSPLINDYVQSAPDEVDIVTHRRLGISIVRRALDEDQEASKD
jgi:hypothetical protein